MKTQITRSVRRTRSCRVLYVMMLYAAGLAGAAELEWPREINAPEGTITLYQPQLDSFKADKLSARAAISFTRKGETEPVFGAVWVTARTLTDRDERTVTLLEIDVPQVKFPNVEEAQLQKLAGVLKREIPKWNVVMSLDRLLTMLDLVEKEQIAADDLKTDPPKILVAMNPAVLVTIDGDPQLGAVEDSHLMRVLNTPFFIVFDPKSGVYYLKGGDDWLAAPDIKGPWQRADRPPAAVMAAAEKSGDLETGGAAASLSEQMPQIIVVTEPTELIVIEGDPRYSIISGTDLLYVSNTEGDVFMHIGSQAYYVLLSGRWYTSGKLEQGAWSYVPADELPAGFGKIPPDSDKANVLVHVSGTEQAKEAILDAHVPQTAAVTRSEATVVVVYDGDPKFVKIEGTNMDYAVNTASSVVRVGTKYYCCDGAVWFVADGPLGPWTVSVSVPTVIYTIPPSCPVYHVRYVYVYSYTPTVVYVGYTPGYVGCYVYRGTVVYGTGFVYVGWRGRVYYPRPATWGVAVRYNPYTGGWGIRVGYRGAGGWVSVGYRRAGWWGPRGYRGYGSVSAERSISGPRGSYQGSIDVERRGARTEIDIERQLETQRGTLTGNTSVDIDRRTGEVDVERNLDFQPNENLYDQRQDVASNRSSTRAENAGSATAPAGASTTQSRASAGTSDRQRNNVYADRDGNVHRRTDQGWQQRGSSGWSSSKPSNSSLNRDHNARQRGSTRTQGYQQSRSSGGSRGGGRGGRR
ncbi:MAG: carbohydrate-binding family V/XII [Planctomycetota bacterium]